MPIDIDDFGLGIEGQDEGLELQILHPVTGEPVEGMVYIVAGPDSNAQRKARHEFLDKINAQTRYVGSNRIDPSAAFMETEHIKRLAKHVIAWRVTSNGEDVPHTLAAVIDHLTRFEFVREQVEAFGKRRDVYFLRTPFKETFA